MMVARNKHEVTTPSQALAYITDCTLATVCGLAMKKSRGKYEFNRQKAIAKTAIDWMQQMKIDFSGTRAVDVVACGGVDEWAEKYINEFSKVAK